MVPQLWVEGRMCKWPSHYKSAAVSKAISACEVPQDSWEEYDVNIKFTADTVLDARNLLRRAEHESEAEAEEGKPSKRKPKPNQRYRIEDSEEEDLPKRKLAKAPSVPTLSSMLREAISDEFCPQGTPETFCSQDSPETFNRQQTLESFNPQGTPEMLCSQDTRDAFRQQWQRSPETFQRHRTPETFQRHRTPETFQRHRIPETFQRHQTPETFRQQQTPETLQRQQTPETLQRQQTPETFNRHQTPETFRQQLQQTPETFNRHQTPETFRQQRQGPPETFNRPGTPEIFHRQHLNPSSSDLDVHSALLREILIKQEITIDLLRNQQYMLQQQHSAPLPDLLPVPQTFPLPIKDAASLRSLDEEMKNNPDQRRHLVLTLGLSGGVSLKDTVWRAMRTLLINDLACCVNWTGLNGKVPFQSLELKNVITDAVRRNSRCCQATNQEVEKLIKRWLYLAADREGGRKRRQNN